MWKRNLFSNRSRSGKSSSQTLIWDDRARYLLRLFLAIRNTECGEHAPAAPFLADKGSHTSFTKLCSLLESYEQRHLSIPPYAYIKAHVALYGKSTHPQHLISSHSYAIYTQWAATHYARRAPQTSLEQEQELLDYLSTCRGLSRREIMTQMPWLFSDRMRKQVLYE